jgi:hypothetical protein
VPHEFSVEKFSIHHELATKAFFYTSQMHNWHALKRLQRIRDYQNGWQP